MAKEMIGFFSVKNIKPAAVGAVITFEFKADKFPSDELMREINCKTVRLKLEEYDQNGKLDFSDGVQDVTRN